MVSMKLLYSALFSGVALAQTSNDAPMGPPNASFSDADIQRVLAGVDQSERSSWCTGQQTNCDILCEADTDDNLCDPATLDFSCTCSSNSSAPALEYYLNTVPSYECQWLNADCVESNAGRLAAQRACNTTYACGRVDANEGTDDSDSGDSGDSGSSDSGDGSSTTPSSEPAPSETGGAAPETSGDAAFALKVGQQYGAGILGAALFAAMTVLF